jgi:hypothetical protein
LVAAILSILVVLGVIKADDFDAEQVTNTIAGVISIISLILARVNVIK